MPPPWTDWPVLGCLAAGFLACVAGGTALAEHVVGAWAGGVDGLAGALVAAVSVDRAASVLDRAARHLGR